MASNPKINVINLTVKYRRKNTPALNRVTFGLTRGVTSLVGPNGSGKSSLIRVLATLQTGFQGDVNIFGCSIKNKKDLPVLRQKIGYLPQDFSFAPNWTVSEFLEYCAWLKKFPKTKTAKAISESLEQVDLTANANTKLGALSGGMLRRAGIAQAIVHNPELLILDEPSAALDPEQRVYLRDIIAKLATEKTVLTSTHLIDEAANHSQYILMLTAGEIKFAGSHAAFDEITQSFTSEQGISRAEQAYLMLQRK